MDLGVFDPSPYLTSPSQLPIADSEVDDADLSPVSPLRRRTLRWSDYPQNLFRNWTPKQVAQSGIEKALSVRHDGPTTIYNVDVLDTGKFRRPGEEYIGDGNLGELWEIMGLEVCIFLIDSLWWPLWCGVLMLVGPL